MASYEDRLRRIVEKYDKACRDNKMTLKQVEKNAQRIKKLVEEYHKEFGKDLYPRD